MVPVSLDCFLAVNYYECSRIIHNITEYKMMRNLAQRNVNRRVWEWGLQNEPSCFSIGNVLVRSFPLFGKNYTHFKHMDIYLTWDVFKQEAFESVWIPFYLGQFGREEGVATGICGQFWRGKGGATGIWGQFVRGEVVPLACAGHRLGTLLHNLPSTWWLSTTKDFRSPHSKGETDEILTKTDGTLIVCGENNSRSLI